jgi:hypothetical protein
MNIRINDFGAMMPSYIGELPECASRRLAIVKFQPCNYYGRLEEYLNDGWEDHNIWLAKKNQTISKNFFNLKETTLVIADIEYDYKNGDTTLTSVGERLLNLTEEEYLNFFEVYKIASKKLTERCKQNN